MCLVPELPTIVRVNPRNTGCPATQTTRRRSPKLCLLGLLLLQLLLVELEFLALEDVTVSAAALAGAAADASKKTAGHKLLVQLGVKLKLTAARLDLLLSLGVHAADVLKLGRGLSALADADMVVVLKPLTEGKTVDEDDRVLHKSLGTHKLVVRCVVDNVQNTGLARDGFRSPAVVACVQAERAVLEVATTTADQVDTLGAYLCHSRSTAHLVLALLLVDGAAAAGAAALVVDDDNASSFRRLSKKNNTTTRDDCSGILYSLKCVEPYIFPFQGCTNIDTRMVSGFHKT